MIALLVTSPDNPVTQRATNCPAMMLCWLGIHRWEWIAVREPFGCVDRLRCRRCGVMPAYPFDDYRLCGGVRDGRSEGVCGTA